MRPEQIRRRETEVQYAGAAYFEPIVINCQTDATSDAVIAMTPRLAKALKEWIAIHPGGQRLFIRSCRRPNNQFWAKTDMSLAAHAVEYLFRRIFKNSKWHVLKGWHVFRHSFCSCCAAKGIDQRKINAWVGHQTDEMAKRYRHLFPNQQHEDIASVYG
jgi:integrase